MLKINKKQVGSFFYFEATFEGGNLCTFTIKEMIEQLTSIYGFKLSLFQFDLN